ncbi:N-terminal C2 in EEIG1 and EHBP1 proteins family protein [Cryptosporidium meleagridis]|uniref:N-terminal C2 in EEIG1 and EHBP1 proteins family protein n=1 Tax=Cryptosporidium meleagridis TaxID=93969 RepID=A0A2P4Z1S1_9CRYT|nr:N-terminal C2 in EEIG1 and EHBP1 proteins family protein [Cryptosporidium meleagridis]
MRLVRAVKHIGQNAEKFRFDLKVENLHVFLHEQCEITIDWIRGPKRISGKEAVSCVNGSIIHPFYQPMVLIATLFQKSSQKQGKAQENCETFLPKDSRLVIHGKFKDNPLVSLIGEVPLELSSFANSYRLAGYESSEPVKVEIPLIKCSDPNSYIEIYISCSSLGQVSEGFDDTASMMSGFTTVYSEISENPIQNMNEFKNNFARVNELSSVHNDGITQKEFLGKHFDKKKDNKLSCESTLGIPMFSIKEDIEVINETVREAEELTETATIIDVEVNNEKLESQIHEIRQVKDESEAKNNGLSQINKNEGNQRVNPSYYPNPMIKISSQSMEDFKAFNVTTDQGIAKVSSPQSSISYEILTQRLYMEQEENKRRIHEYNMEINSLKQQLQIYSEQEKSWKQREADLMNEIMILRNTEDLIDKPDDKNSIENNKCTKVVGLDDYCLLQQEVSELTGIRDELRRLRESDRFKYEKYIAQLENQVQDITKQLEVYKKNGRIQDEVEEEIFSVPKHPTFFATANSNISDSTTVNKTNKLNASIGDDTSTGNHTINIHAYHNHNLEGGSSTHNLSYGFEEIERELISTKLALAQTETNYQVEVNNLRSRIEKQRKQLLSYSSYVGNLEVINADLKYGARKHKDLSFANEDLDESSVENQNRQTFTNTQDNDGSGKTKSRGNMNTINSYWKTFKQRIR